MLILYCEIIAYASRKIARTTSEMILQDFFVTANQAWDQEIWIEDNTIKQGEKLSYHDFYQTVLNTVWNIHLSIHKSVDDSQ